VLHKFQNTHCFFHICVLGALNFKTLQSGNIRCLDNGYKSRNQNFMKIGQNTNHKNAPKVLSTHYIGHKNFSFDIGLIRNLKKKPLFYGD
jgi:hypothetical protein